MDNSPVWLPVNEEGLSSSTEARYAELAKARLAEKSAKAVFEAAFSKDNADKVPKGTMLAFGYRFGKLAVAIVPKEASKSTSKAKNYF